jgi:phytoene synthase
MSIAASASANANMDPRSVLRRRGRTFFLASLLLGRVHAGRAATLYAFCRHVDDLADESADPRAARVALAAVTQALGTGRTQDARLQAMLALQAETRMPAAPALALVAGVTNDLDPVRLADEDALIRYAWQVAGTVGLMMCAVLDVDDSRAVPFAIDLGIAMQLTNIARDVGEDARVGRRYLPGSWIGDTPPAAIVAPTPALQATLRDATRRLLALAERYYASGESGLGFLPARARLAILAAARMYRAIGGRIVATDHQSWDRRAVVGPLAKTRHAAGAVLAFACSPRLHRRDNAHDASLQRALRMSGDSEGSE